MKATTPSKIRSATCSIADRGASGALEAPNVEQLTIMSCQPSSVYKLEPDGFIVGRGWVVVVWNSLA
eukprot:4679888-Alexandrium_andersonii.AAC.1